MDTSETYIKMCEKAEELQKEWNCFGMNPRFGDFYSIKQRTVVIGNESQTMVFVMCDEKAVEKVERGDIIWLPRQDQLQDMVDWNKDFLTLDKIRFFYEFTKSVDWKHRLFYASMEQLWLAFVMKEKFGKVWNGEDWEEKK